MAFDDFPLHRRELEDLLEEDEVLLSFYFKLLSMQFHIRGDIIQSVFTFTMILIKVCVSISAFPRLGCPGFTVPETKPDPEKSFTR